MAASSSSGDNYKTLSGKLVTDKRESYIRVWRCLGDQFIEISFKRTIRVPDNHDKFELPPDLGSFPLFPVAEFTPTMPAEMTAKGGVFFPMHQREAMWINFKASAPFVIKIFVGGINAVSGEPWQEDMDTRIRRLNRLDRGQPIQDYVVVPDQRWLDDIATEGGLVRQFVAMPSGSGYSVEAQVKGYETTGGIQFWIMPTASHTTSTPAYYIIGVMLPTGKIVHLQVHGDQTVRELKGQIKHMTGFEINACHSLRFNGLRIRNDDTLYDLEIAAGDVVEVHRDQVGGGNGKLSQENTEMSVAAGGLIHQSICPDKYSANFWDMDPTHSLLINAQIVNSEMFRQITGLAPPPTPVTAKHYADQGLPFFKLYEEISQVSGYFQDVESVAEMDKEMGGHNQQDSDQISYEFPLVVIDSGRLQSPFRPVSEIK